MTRAYSNQAVQLGAESTAGTSVDADKQLMGLHLDPKPSFETQTFTPSGYKVPTAAAVTSEMTEADFDGPIDYENLGYLLDSMFGSVTATQPDDEGSPTVYQRVWSYTGKDSVTPQTYTVEVGDDDRAVKFTYGTVTSLELGIERTGDNTLSGTMIGQALETGESMTASPTAIDIMPVNGSHWDVYADSTGAALGTTQLLAVYDANLKFSDLFAQEFTLNSSKSSFNSLYEAEEPSFEWDMTLGADAVGEAYLTTARGTTKTFIRLLATGPKIDTTLSYSLQIDMCVLVTEFDSYESNDGLYVLPITFALAYDATWANALKITLVNTQS